MPSLEMLQFLMTSAQLDEEAALLLGDVVQLVKPLSAVFEAPWPERLAASRAT
jgi:hypothetical protein